MSATGLTVRPNGEPRLHRWVHSCAKCRRQRAVWACPQLVDDQDIAPYLCIACARKLYPESVIYWQTEVRS